MSGRIPGIKEAGNMRRCSFIISLTQTFRMATTAFICDVEDSEGSVPSLQLKQRGCSYTLLQVLVGVMAVLMLAMTGYIIWMKPSQNCSWSVVFTDKFTGTGTYIYTNFTSPRTEEYEIRGKIFIKECSGESCRYCNKSFRLLKKEPNTTAMPPIFTTEEVIETTVNLEKGSRLIIELNCKEMEIDKANSTLNVYQKTC